MRPRGVLIESDINLRAFADRVKDDLDLRAFDLYLTSVGNIYLQMIAVRKEDQKGGKGSEAMRRLIEFADQHGKMITLGTGSKDPSFGTTSRSRLKRFYKRFGFVENKGRRKDYSLKGDMYRVPKMREAKQINPTKAPARARMKAALLSDGTVWIADPSVVLHAQLVMQLEAEDALQGRTVVDTGWVDDGSYWGTGMYLAGADAYATENGKLFKTGEPVSFNFIRNTSKAPNMGSRFGQDIEPHGRYLSHDTAGATPPVDPSGRVKWVTGKVSFRNPLVVWYHQDGKSEYSAAPWKKRLVMAFGVKGRALSKFLRNAGFDGIVTVQIIRGKHYTNEIVMLPR